MPPKRRRQSTDAQTTLPQTPPKPLPAPSNRARARRTVERDILKEYAPTALTLSTCAGVSNVDEQQLCCGACLLPIDEENDQKIGLIDSCLHTFHFECIERWATTENSCPQCKSRFFWLAAYGQPEDVQSKKVASSSKKARIAAMQRVSLTRITKRDQEAEEDDAFEEMQVCELCKEVGDEATLLLCDGMNGTCNAAFHCKCVGLTSVPQSSWFCQDCIDRGFDTDARGRRGTDVAAPTSAPPRTQSTNASTESVAWSLTSMGASSSNSTPAYARSSASSAQSDTAARSVRSRATAATAVPSQLRLNQMACVSPAVEVPAFQPARAEPLGSASATAAPTTGLFANFAQRRRAKRSAATMNSSDEGGSISFIALNPTYEDDFMGKVDNR